MPDAPDRECHCLLCEGDGTPRVRWRRAEKSWPERERRNARLVREYGWGVTGVLGLTTPDWAYSIGLWHSYGSVEVCVLGIPQQRAMEIVNTVGRLIRDGQPLTPGRRLTGVIDGHELALAPVHGSWYGQLFGAAIDCYQRPPFPVVQLLWPDKADRYPGGPEFEDGAHEIQPSLWLPMDEHPRSMWTEPTPPWMYPNLDPCQVVFTLKRIMDGGRPVNRVVHDHDGSWQFLDGDAMEQPDVTTAHLVHLVAHHDVGQLLDLPAGWRAWRQRDGSWLRWTVEPQ
ncbi:DUF4262 domain-containing protein [Micromonospora ureilytica]|uniref:DUF4262 domain-containing protein n=1 Tax=Micromonospora ureilytica TaxID=709868 RepID=UPI002E15610A|nr:DUF4262 domain-containing protein [Micromonospora ureilytica]